MKNIVLWLADHPVAHAIVISVWTIVSGVVNSALRGNPEKKNK